LINTFGIDLKFFNQKRPFFGRFWLFPDHKDLWARKKEGGLFFFF